MPIKVTREPDDFGPPYERCCFCGKQTAYWYTPKDVPCCQGCAKTATRKSVPNKDQLFAQRGVSHRES